MENRHIGFLTIFKLLQNKDPRFFIGIIALLVSIATLILTFSLGSDLTEPYEDYDHEAIRINGTDQEAVIVNLESKDNININGKNPLVITYSFKDKGVDKTDKFKTLDIEKAAGLSLGDKLRIKKYNNESSVLGFDPVTFPFFLVLLITPVAFFVIGLSMLLTKLIPALKIYKLYKKGIVQDAEVYSAVAVSGLPISNRGRKVSIDYFYITKNGEKQYGNTTSTDFYLLAEIKPGDKVKIFVSEDGKKSCLIPKNEAIKNNWNINFA